MTEPTDDLPEQLEQMSVQVSTLLLSAAKRIRELEAELAKRSPPPAGRVTGASERPLDQPPQKATKPKVGGKDHGLGRTPVNGTYDGHVPSGASKVTANPLTWPACQPKTKAKVPSAPEHPVNDLDRYIVILARKSVQDRKEWRKLCRAISECRRLVPMQIAGIVAEATKREARRKTR